MVQIKRSPFQNSNFQPFNTSTGSFCSFNIYILQCILLFREESIPYSYSYYLLLLKKL